MDGLGLLGSRELAGGPGVGHGTEGRLFPLEGGAGWVLLGVPLVSFVVHRVSSWVSLSFLQARFTWEVAEATET